MTGAPAAGGRFAITYTVKNEASLLPFALRYHLRLGCARIYVFFDGTTDNSRELIRVSDRIVGRESIDPLTLIAPPDWIKEIQPRWAESMDVRKRINTYVAAQAARADNIEWLVNIDPDELLLLTEGSTDGPGDCEAFFRTVGARIDQVLVPNLEAVPVGEGTGRPFYDCTLFLRRYPVTEFLWRASSALVRRSVPNPKVHAWFDHWFYRFRFAGALPRLMRHPTTGESIPVGYFLGYSNHKAFIRTSAAAQFRFNIHKWERIGRPIRSLKKGFLLHYDLCNAEYFCAKFQQRGPAMLVKAFFTRHAFAQIARELPFATARQFFLDNICIREPGVVARLQRRGVLARIDFISKMMAEGAEH